MSSTNTLLCYKRVKGRSHTVEIRNAIHPQKPHAISQPSRFSHTPRLRTNAAHMHMIVVASATSEGCNVLSVQVLGGRPPGDWVRADAFLCT